MKVDIFTSLRCSYELAVLNVMTTRLLLYVDRLLVSFEPVAGQHFPPNWSSGTHWVKVRLFGFVPFRPQAIVLSLPAAATGFAMQDAGYSALIPVWNHLITIVPMADGVLYRD